MLQRIYEIFQGYGTSIWNALPQLILGLILALVFLIIGWLIKKLVSSRLQKRMDDVLLRGYISRIVFSIFIVIAVVVFLGQLGLAKAASGLLAGAGVTAIILGFAFRDIGENFLSGFFLAFGRPFQVGDVIETNSIVGTVRSLNFRNSQIRTFDGKDVFVPNSMLIKDILINYTRDGLQRHDFIIGLDYESDLKQAINLILQTLHSEEEIEKEGILKPFITIDKFATSTINIKIHYWINNFSIRADLLSIKTRVMYDILKVLKRDKFSLPADIIELKIYQEGHPIPIHIQDLESRKTKEEK